MLFPNRTWQLKNWDIWNASACKWGILSSLNYSQWFPFALKIPFHSPMLILIPCLPRMKYIHTSCFTEDWLIGIFHWVPSNSAVTIKSSEKVSLPFRVLQTPPISGSVSLFQPCVQEHLHTQRKKGELRNAEEGQGAQIPGLRPS